MNLPFLFFFPHEYVVVRLMNFFMVSGYSGNQQAPLLTDSASFPKREIPLKPPASYVFLL